MPDPTPAALAKLIRDLTRQMGALLLRLEAIEKRLGAPARPKTEKLSREEWLVRKRNAMRIAAEHRWAKSKRIEAKRAEAKRPAVKRRRRGKGRPK